MIKNHKLILFFIILLLAAFFRFYGVNWDQDQHLHPDERFLTMVTDAIDWPANFREYLDTAISPLNPHNRGFGFFVYGTFPIFFTKWVIGLLTKENYSNITIIGRYLSGIVDLGTVVLVFLIGRELVASSMHQVASKYKKLHTTYYILHTTFPLLAMFLYSIMVLPIQLSHFYAVDTYLTFFITLTFYFLIKIISLPDFNFLPPAKSRYSENLWGFNRFLLLNVLLGISFGLSLASKISAILFLPIISLGLLFYLIKNRNLRLFFARPVASLLCFGVLCSLFLVFTYITFRLAQPYAFANGNFFDITLNQKVVENWKQLSIFMKPSSGFPPSIQWFHITPIIFPLRSYLLWGVGLPLGLLSILGISWLICESFKKIILFIQIILSNLNKKKHKLNDSYNVSEFIILIMLLWIIGFFTYQGIQSAPTIRYFQTIYPFIAVITSLTILNIYNKMSKLNRKAAYFILLAIIFSILIWPLSFMSIYSTQHSRVSASSWIYKNIPYNSTIAVEHWDDGIPVTLDAVNINEKYKYVSLPLYNPDSPEKWQELSRLLEKSDYIALTSNRLWGSLTRVPEIFPVTAKYYQLLFAGKLGFQKIAEFTSYPSLNIPLFGKCLYVLYPQEKYLGLSTEKSGFIKLDRCDIYTNSNYQGVVIRDDSAEETFTVYDHPKVIIFKKDKPVDYFSLLYNPQNKVNTP